MDQLLAHLAGDYLLQNAWMAQKKHISLVVALLHGAVYSLPFILITQSLADLLIIGISHALIDHYSIGLRLMWLKDQLAPGEFRSSWKTFKNTFPAKPEWLSSWLRIIIDNTLHLLINYAVLIK
jgi:hypothetical protein